MHPQTIKALIATWSGNSVSAHWGGLRHGDREKRTRALRRSGCRSACARERQLEIPLSNRLLGQANEGLIGFETPRLRA